MTELNHDFCCNANCDKLQSSTMTSTTIIQQRCFQYTHPTTPANKLDYGFGSKYDFYLTIITSMTSQLQLWLQLQLRFHFYLRLWLQLQLQPWRYLLLQLQLQLSTTSVSTTATTTTTKRKLRLQDLLDVWREGLMCRWLCDLGELKFWGDLRYEQEAEREREERRQRGREGSI